MAAGTERDNVDFGAAVVLIVVGDGQRAAHGIKRLVRPPALLATGQACPSAGVLDGESDGVPIGRVGVFVHSSTSTSTPAANICCSAAMVRSCWATASAQVAQRRHSPR